MRNTCSIQILFFIFLQLFLTPHLTFAQNWVEIEYKFPLRDSSSIIHVQDFGDYYVYQGDIVIQKSASRSFLSSGANLWNCGIIPYTLENLSSEQNDNVQEAILQINENTALLLRPRKSGDDDFITIRNCESNNCDVICGQSSVGRQGGQQFIEYVEGCIWGTLAHEILHAAGFLHEQSRPDRDNFVRINTQNILPGFETQFATESGTIFGNYDYESIMHYGSTAFSRNGNATISVLNGDGTVIGQRTYISEHDAAGTRQVYPCGTEVISNDECINAITLQPCYTITTNNENATNSASVPDFSCYTGNVKDVWFKIYPTLPDITIETTQKSGGLTDMVMQVFSGTCANLTEIACNDDDGSGSHAAVSLTLPNLNPVYVRITDFGANDIGPFGLLYTKISNSGTSIFSSHKHISGDGPHVLDLPSFAADINGDALTDVVLIYQDPVKGLTIRTKMSNGDGTFTPKSAILGDGPSVNDLPSFIGDVNGDGKSDVIFIYQDPSEGLTIRTKLSNGDGSFTKKTAVMGDGPGINNLPSFAADINGDKKCDMVFIYQDPVSGLTIRTKMSNGDGTFTPYTAILGDGAGVHDYPTLIGDVNGDGKDDVIFIFYHPSNGLTIRTKISNGDGSFTKIEDIQGDGQGVLAYSTLTGDVNGDGKTDLIFNFHDKNRGLIIRTKFSNGDGTYSSKEASLGGGAGVHENPVLVCDVNGDGKDDLIFEGQDWTGCGLNIRVKYSKGDGTWCSDMQIAGDGSGVQAYPALIGDVNGDKKADLFFLLYSSTEGVSIRTKLSQSTIICSTVNIETIEEDDFIEVFPNPVSNYLQLRGRNPDEIEITLINVMGQVVISDKKINASLNLDISALPAGIYMLYASNNKSALKAVKKIVK